jgi:hypothetical protein
MPPLALLWSCDRANGFGLRYLNYEGEIAATDSATILANPHEHWMLWLQN